MKNLPVAAEVRIELTDCRIQRPMPYRLATPHCRTKESRCFRKLSLNDIITLSFAFVKFKKKSDITSHVIQVRESTILVNAVRLLEPLADVPHKRRPVPNRVYHPVAPFAVLLCAVCHHRSHRLDDFGRHKVKPRLSSIVFESICHFIHGTAPFRGTRRRCACTSGQAVPQTRAFAQLLNCTSPLQSPVFPRSP